MIFHAKYPCANVRLNTYHLHIIIHDNYDIFRKLGHLQQPNQATHLLIFTGKYFALYSEFTNLSKAQLKPSYI